jgi:hypothetical protein
MNTWDDEGIWNAVFGLQTPASILSEAASQSIAPQDFASACIYDAIATMGDDGGLEYLQAYVSLCRQLGVEVS